MQRKNLSCGELQPMISGIIPKRDILERLYSVLDLRKLVPKNVKNPHSLLRLLKRKNRVSGGENRVHAVVEGSSRGTGLSLPGTVWITILIFCKDTGDELVLLMQTHIVCSSKSVSARVC